MFLGAADVADEESQQNGAASAEDSDKAFRVKVKSLSVVNMVGTVEAKCIEEAHVKGSRSPSCHSVLNCLAEEEGALSIAEEPENQHFQKGQHNHCADDFLGFLEPEGKQSADNVAHGNSLQHSEYPQMPELLRHIPPEAVVRIHRELDERKGVEGKSYQENQRAPYQKLLDACLGKALPVLGKRECHCRSNHKQEEREDKVRRSAAGPGGVPQWFEYMPPAAGVVYQNHTRYSHTPENIQGYITGGLYLCHIKTLFNCQTIGHTKITKIS